MISVDRVFHYFPNLTDKQKEQFAALYDVYKEWNDQINVVSRKDFDLYFYEHHVLHSLGIAKMVDFKPTTSVLDVGTGGGFPGIPLAILYPKVNFHLVDSIGKKIKVVHGVVEALGLKNVTAAHQRAEEVKQKFDFVVSRAVTQIDKFLPWVSNKFYHKQKNAYPNGIFYLKGGDLTEEFNGVRCHTEILDLEKYFAEEFFETKKVVYIKMI
ncbi:MAG: 16S rRNA (guanine(527)-N(7))-methyltransferase RsmG [Crocinitomix sp.]|nr:16S rRNA (guanine(527)-N(7))-methyltransferase RsmG [Crocinitomix sp.]